MTQVSYSAGRRTTGVSSGTSPRTEDPLGGSVGAAQTVGCEVRVCGVRPLPIWSPRCGVSEMLPRSTMVRATTDTVPQGPTSRRRGPQAVNKVRPCVVDWCGCIGVHARSSAIEFPPSITTSCPVV